MARTINDNEINKKRERKRQTQTVQQQTTEEPIKKLTFAGNAQIAWREKHGGRGWLLSGSPNYQSTWRLRKFRRAEHIRPLF